MPSNISGSRIRQKREEKGLDQSDLASSLRMYFTINLAQSDISEIERGVRSVKDFELDAIAKILEVNPTWLLRGE